MAIHKAKIVTITSVKGGVGKTFLTLNLASTLMEMHKRVLVIDLDLYTGDIAAMLNVDNDKDLYLLYEDLTNNRFRLLDDYVVTYKDGIDVIPAPKDPRFASKMNSMFLSVVFGKAAMKYDVILIDTTHLLDEINLVTYDHSDSIIYLITNNAMDLKSMRTMTALFKDMELDTYKVVLNEAISKQNYFTKQEIEDIIKKNIDYILPESLYVKKYNQYIMDGKIPVLEKTVKKSNKKGIKTLNKMAEDLFKEKVGE